MLGNFAERARRDNAQLDAVGLDLSSVGCLLLAVRPEGAEHQWRKIPPGELSIDPVADERFLRVTAWIGAS